MGAIDYTQLLRFAQDLHRAEDFSQLLATVRAATEGLVGYRHAWLAIFEPDRSHARILAFAPGGEVATWDQAQLIPVAGDQMMAEILEKKVVIVEDARSDPRTNKAIVAAMENRTIINVPLVLLEAPLGSLGVGTFGPEGVTAPSQEQIATLEAMASQLSVAASRLLLSRERVRAVEERAELTRRLLQAQKLESLGLLAGGLAHDFNNLLQVVLSSATFIGEGPLTENQRVDLRTLVDASERGAALSRQLLALGRRQPQALEALDVNERLRGVVALLARLLPANIEVDLIEASHLPRVLADGGQFDQILINLSLNARDAMPEGGRLTLESETVLLNGAYVNAHPWAKPGRYVLISVSDNGLGMPPEVVDRIFEPFFSTKGPDHGSGLGLAIAYGIVQQHHGMMHVYSEEKVGSTFKVYLPAYERGAASVGPKLSAAILGGHERILVAEDDEQVRAVIARILTRAGYKVKAVSDGSEAVAAVAGGEHFDAIVLDAMMPKMGGQEAYEQLRPLEPHAAFLFSSGYAADLLPSHVLNDLGIEVLQKPYDPDQLLRAVRRALDARPK